MRGDFSRYAWVYFLLTSLTLQRHSKKCLADLRVEGVPSEVVVVRSDDGGEFNEGKFGKLCRERTLSKSLQLQIAQSTMVWLNKD